MGCTIASSGLYGFPCAGMQDGTLVTCDAAKNAVVDGSVPRTVEGSWVPSDVFTIRNANAAVTPVTMRGAMTPSATLKLLFSSLGSVPTGAINLFRFASPIVANPRGATSFATVSAVLEGMETSGASVGSIFLRWKYVRARVTDREKCGRVESSDMVCRQQCNVFGVDSHIRHRIECYHFVRPRRSVDRWYRWHRCRRGCGWSVDRCLCGPQMAQVAHAGCSCGARAKARLCKG